MASLRDRMKKYLPADRQQSATAAAEGSVTEKQPCSLHVAPPVAPPVAPTVAPTAPSTSQAPTQNANSLAARLSAAQRRQEQHELALKTSLARAAQLNETNNHVRKSTVAADSNVIAWDRRFRPLEHQGHHHREVTTMRQVDGGIRNIERPVVATTRVGAGPSSYEDMDVEIQAAAKTTTISSMETDPDHDPLWDYEPTPAVAAPAATKPKQARAKPSTTTTGSRRQQGGGGGRAQQKRQHVPAAPIPLDDNNLDISALLPKAKRAKTQPNSSSTDAAATGKRSTAKNAASTSLLLDAPTTLAEDLGDGIDTRDNNNAPQRDATRLLDNLLNLHSNPNNPNKQPTQQEEEEHRPNAPTDGVNEDYLVRMNEDGSSDLEEESDTHQCFLELAVPANINKYLRPYQREGVRFLLRRYALGSGGLLGDDMGLGKTIQAIAFCAAVLGKTGDQKVDAEVRAVKHSAIDPPAGAFKAADNNVTTITAGMNICDSDQYSPDYSEHTNGAPILIVCPNSVMANWQAEFATWGTFSVAIGHGTSKESALSKALNGLVEIVITSNKTLAASQDVMCSVPWHMVIFDEVHTLKNVRTQNWQAADRLPTRLRYGLSGTPMQNDYEELYHVMNLLVPRGLGASCSTLTTEISMPIKIGQQVAANDADIAAGEQAKELLRSKLSQLMLRRNKSIIADQLPRKRDQIVFCELSDMQLRAYQRVLDSPDVQGILKAQEPCPCGSKKSIKECKSEDCPGYFRISKGDGGVFYPYYHDCECDNPKDDLHNPDGCPRHRPDGCWHRNARICPSCIGFPILHLLRNICNHLELIKADKQLEETDPEKFYQDLDVADLVLGEDADQLGGLIAGEEFSRLADTRTCGKMQALEALLLEWYHSPENNKVLIFSSSVKMLRIVRKMVDRLSFEYEYLDGSTDSKERQPKVNSFNRPGGSCFCFLISTLAGGTGLNLTAANKVVILNPNFNPSVDLQAMDRAFRIGQKRDVHCYRFVAAGTIEECVYARQIYKQQHSNIAIEGTVESRLFDGVKGVENGDLWGMANLLSFRPDDIRTLDLVKLRGRRTDDQGAQYWIEDFEESSPDAEGDGDGGNTNNNNNNCANANHLPAQGGGGNSSRENHPLWNKPGEGGSIDRQQDEEEDKEATQQTMRRTPRRQQQQVGQFSRQEAIATTEAEILRKAGVAGIMTHDDALGADDEEKTLRLTAVQAIATQRRQNDVASAQAAVKAATMSGQQPEKYISRTNRAQSGFLTSAAAAAAASVLKKSGQQNAVNASTNRQHGGGSDDVKEGGGRKNVNVKTMSALESLAQWQGVSVEALAATLLEQSKEDRDVLRMAYAAYYDEKTEDVIDLT